MKIKSHCQDIIYLSYWYQMSSDTSALLIFTDCHCFCCNKRLHKRWYLPLYLISSDFLVTTEISPWDNKYLPASTIQCFACSECCLRTCFQLIKDIHWMFTSDSRETKHFYVLRNNKVHFWGSLSQNDRFFFIV